MTKEKYLEIITKIDAIENKFWELDETDEDYDDQVGTLSLEVGLLHLDNIKLPIIPKKTNEVIEPYIVLDPEFEFPVIYEIPFENYEEVTETLYEVYTNYRDRSEFYDSVGITLSNLIALVLNCKGLPITSFKSPVKMNNVRYWNSMPYTNSLLSMVSSENKKNSR